MENKQVEKVEKWSFWKDERGDFGVKQLAATIGVIILIALVVSYLKGGVLTGMVDKIWTYIYETLIQGMTG
ncbi:hypothetical protein RE628_06270 [Paenibacillus sp. D2_2]|uniref:hypothetical protein n=1 Tax=Paenibacillus sp. D2_2 TaxID=3073092 RepID=UPI0028161E4C|nr:hypothetical protein [Paenibacillus sp. D2_2]WMT42038.1 hypothetical protein RE628_06270 [Paenibacillus sp. D2_2]